MNQFKGAGVALVTPFSADMSIDFPALRQLVREQIAGGTNFLVVQGTTGESPTLTSDEKLKVLETVQEENNGQLPIVYGVGGNNTMAVAEAFSKIPAGVDGILSVAPYYNKPIQRGFVAHYKAIAQATASIMQTGRQGVEPLLKEIRIMRAVDPGKTNCQKCTKWSKDMAQ